MSDESTSVGLVQRAFAAMRSAHEADRFPSYHARLAALRRLRDVFSSQSKQIEAACDADYGGRSTHETRLGEVWITHNQLNYAIKHLKRWMKARPAPVPLTLKLGSAYRLPQPKGVIGIIAPWNYPFMLALQPLIGAVAAGNRALIKPSEFAPRSAEVLQELLQRAKLEEVVRVVQGGSDVGIAFADLPLDHLLFTGSTAVGRKVYARAAAQLTPVTLELGGKTPAWLHSSFSVARYAQAVLQGKCFNAGQSCIAPDYLLVPEVMVSEVVGALTTCFALRYPTLRDNPDYSAILDEQKRARLVALIADARARGSEVVELNPSGENLTGTKKLPLTLLLNVPPEARVSEEECFGPVLPIQTYSSDAEALRAIHAKPRPLALYYFDESSERTQHVLRQTIAGGVTVNDTLLHFICDSLPRSATGTSGMGQYHGSASFDTFSHFKSVFVQSPLNAIGAFAPPYGARFDAIYKWLVR